MGKQEIEMHCLCETMRNVLLRILISHVVLVSYYELYFSVQVVPKASKKVV